MLKRIREESVKMYVVLMFTLLPLYYTDNYYNILNDKKTVFVIFSKILMGVMLINLLLSFGKDLYQKQIKNNLKAELKKINAMDVCMVLFAGIAVLSLYFAPDYYSCLSGKDAWGVGAYVIVLGTIMYFIISRCFSGKPDLWAYLYLGSLAVLIIGVLDRLGYDILIMHDEIPLQYNIFISTVGNVNFWAAYLSMIVPFFMLAAVFITSRIRRFMVYALLEIAYFSLFITLTNTTYAGIGVAALFIVWYSLKNTDRLKNLAINGLLFSIAGCAAEVCLRNPDLFPRPIDTDTISYLLLTDRLYLLPGIVGVLLGIFLCVNKETENGKTKSRVWIEKYLSQIWLALVLIGIVIFGCYIVFNFNLKMFNYRGSIWYFAFRGFVDGSLRQKLIGAGPGLLDIVTQNQIAKATFAVEWYYLYCTAHNDLLEYLVTMGIFGVLVKIGMYLVPFVMYARRKAYQPQKAAVLAALTGFIGQGIFTGPYILTYVLYIIFLGILCAYDRMGKDQ